MRTFRAPPPGRRSGAVLLATTWKETCFSNKRTSRMTAARRRSVRGRLTFAAGIERFFSARSNGLLVAGITGADGTAHDYGGESEVYREVVQAVDRCLGSLVKALDDGRTVFVAVSDHGHIDHRGGGGHGGSEPEVMEVPLVLFGKESDKPTGGKRKWWTSRRRLRCCSDCRCRRRIRAMSCGTVWTCLMSRRGRQGNVSNNSRSGSARF